MGRFRKIPDSQLQGQCQAVMRCQQLGPFDFTDLDICLRLVDRAEDGVNQVFLSRAKVLVEDEKVAPKDLKGLLAHLETMLFFLKYAKSEDLALTHKEFKKQTYPLHPAVSSYLDWAESMYRPGRELVDLSRSHSLMDSTDVTAVLQAMRVPQGGSPSGLEMFREIFYQQEPKFPGENSQDVIFQVLDTRLLVIGRLVTCLQSSVELCREASPAPSCEGKQFNLLVLPHHTQVENSYFMRLAARCLHELTLLAVVLAKGITPCVPFRGNLSIVAMAPEADVFFPLQEPQPFVAPPRSGWLETLYKILPIVEWLPAYSWQEHGVKERCCELAAPDLTVTASQNVPEGGRLLAQIASKLAREDSGKTE
eukprot:s1874_g6.t1